MEGAETDTIIFHFYDKKDIRVNSHRDYRNQNHNILPKSQKSLGDRGHVKDTTNNVCVCGDHSLQRQRYVLRVLASGHLKGQKGI